VSNSDPNYVEAVQAIEDHTAEILDGRESCTDLELLMRGLCRRGYLDGQGYQDALTHLNKIRHALELGRKYAGRARKAPL
jgi:hypothetical protein